MTSTIDTTKQIINSPVIHKDNILKSIPNGLIFNFILFLQESDLACFSSTCKTFTSSQMNFIDRKFIAWKKLLNSVPQCIKFPFPLDSFRLIKNNLFCSSHYRKKRFFLDLTNLNTLRLVYSKEQYYDCFLHDSEMNERITVSRLKEPGMKRYHLKVYDNEKNSLICKINLMFDEYNLVNVFGTKNMDQTLEFVTDKGNILLLDLNNISKSESDKKEFGKERFRVISCGPKDFEEVSKSQYYGVTEVYKIRDTYYFNWSTGPNGKVIFIRNMNFPDQQKELITLKSYTYVCAADDYFFYVAHQNIIKIYIGESVWKTIKVNETFFKLKLFPNNYNLVVAEARNMEESEITVWDHRKYDPEVVVTPLFKTRIKSDRKKMLVERDLLIYEKVERDLLIYEKNTKLWEVYHLGKKEVVTVLSPSCCEIADVVISNNPMPDRFIIQCGDIEDLDKPTDVKIFSPS